jgi:hypothetical protein
VIYVLAGVNGGGKSSLGGAVLREAGMAWFNPAWKGKITFPNWLQFFNYFGAIRQAPIASRQKLFCYLTMLQWAVVHGKSMSKDVIVAVQMATRTKEWRKNVYSYNWE